MHTRTVRTIKTLRILPVLLAAATLFAAQNARAGDCTARVASGNISLPAVNFVDNTGLETPIQIDVTCKKSASVPVSQPQTQHVCMGADGGRNTTYQSQFTPRIMCPGNGSSCSDPTKLLKYNLYTGPSASSPIWGSNTYKTANNFNSSNIINMPLVIPAGQSQASTSVYAYMRVEPGQKLDANTTYTASYVGGSANMKSNPRGQNCSNDVLYWDSNDFAGFIINVQIVKGCHIATPDNINFGEHSYKDAGLVGQTNLNVTCTSGVPYQIGLSSKYGDKTGHGQMKHATAATLIPYALRRSGSLNGQYWGDSGSTPGTQGSVGGFTGTGELQTHAVYATLSQIPDNADAGDYSDTVTVNVYY